MKSKNLSSRKTKNIACKSRHAHFFVALHGAIKRSPGGIETMSHHTDVEASTLRNQINPDRHQDTPTVDTLLRVIEHLRDDDFSQWAWRYYFDTDEHEDQSCLDLCAVLHLVNTSSGFISTATNAAEDGVFTLEEKRAVLSALNKSIAEKQAAAAQLSSEIETAEANND